MTINITVPDTFTGPFDLLLYLVRRDEIDLRDIPLAKLTKEYLAEINQRGLVDVDNGGEFIAMATTLLEMKSRELLPKDALNPDGDDPDDFFDPRVGLGKALLEYKSFKQAAGELAAQAERHGQRFFRELAVDSPVAIVAPELRSPWELFAAFQKIAQQIIAENRRRQIVNEEIPTEVRIAHIENILKIKTVVRFTELLPENPDRHELIGFFIAILELIRLKKIVARQAVDFSEIYLHPTTDQKTATENRDYFFANSQQRRQTPRFALFSSFRAVVSQPANPPKNHGGKFGFPPSFHSRHSPTVAIHKNLAKNFPPH